MKLNSIAAVGISLDSSVLPRSNWALKAAQAYGAYAFLLLASYKVMGVLVRSGAIDSVADSIANTYDEIKIKTKEFVNNKYIGSTFDALSTAYYMLTDEILPLVAFALRVFASKISLYTEDLRSTLGNVFNLFPPEDIDIKEWKTCTLFERESISPRHNRYRFELANADGVLPLYVGQELMMCAVDEKDRVYKESFFPVSDPSIKGYFDIIVKNDKDPIDNFANAINNLELGDELAFKAGKYRLNYAGADERIDSLALVASGSGIEPVLGVLRGILRDRDSTVEDIELLWLNEKKTDYVLNDDVQALEYRHVEKLFVSRVIQRDLYGANILKSREVADSVSPYEEGRLAIICGPGSYFLFL